MHVIYKYTNLSNRKVYIGQTCNIPKRKARHLLESRKENPPNPFHRALKKYGVEGFDFTILKKDIPQKDVDFWEIFFIKECNSFSSGYNLTEGGGGLKGRSGDNCPNSKISEQEAIFIIQDGRSKKCLGEILGISTCIIDEIRRNKTWKHLRRPKNKQYHHGNSTVSDHTAINIINDPCSHKEAAKKYNTTYCIITSIRSGLTKTHLDISKAPVYQRKKNKLSEADAINIVNSSLSNIRIAEFYGISKDMVSHIRSGKRWKHIDRSGAPAYENGRNKK